MAELTVQEVSKTGIAPTYAAAAAGGDTFINGPSTWIHVKNTNAAARTITISKAVSTVQVDTHGGLDPGNISVIVPATTGDMIIVAPFGSYGGKPTITYSADTGVTVAAFKLPRGL